MISTTRASRQRQRAGRRRAGLALVGLALCLAIAGAWSSLAGASAVGVRAGASVPAGVRGADVSFVNSQIGFVLGTATCTHPPCTVVLRTLDRGKSWSRLAAPPQAVSFPGQNGIWAVDFSSVMRGYAYGQGLWQTDDGASSWTVLSSPGTLLALAVFKNRELFVITSCAGKKTCLSRMPVGATRWQQVLSSTGQGAADLAIHGNVVWALVAGKLYVSSDAGATFRAARRPCPTRRATLPQPDLIADDGPHTYLLCGGPAWTGHIEKYVYRTPGPTSGWTLVGQPPPAGGITGIAAGGDHSLVISASSALSLLYRSTDAGSQWRTPLSYADGGAGWAGLGFTSASDGAVIHGPLRQGQLLLTDDGGRNWHVSRF